MNETQMTEEIDEKFMPNVPTLTFRNGEKEIQVMVWKEFNQMQISITKYGKRSTLLTFALEGANLDSFREFLNNLPTEVGA